MAKKQVWDVEKHDDRRFKSRENCANCGVKVDKNNCLDNGRITFCSFACHDEYMDKQENDK